MVRSLAKMALIDSDSPPVVVVVAVVLMLGGVGWAMVSTTVMVDMVLLYIYDSDVVALVFFGV